MATTRTRSRGRFLTLTPTDGWALSNDPGRAGQITGIALTNKDATLGTTSVDTLGVYLVSVKGIDGGGNSAVGVGDIIYYVDGDTPKLSKKATGVYFGKSLDTLGAGSTGNLNVRLG
jgi:hypothetical protein